MPPYGPPLKSSPSTTRSARRGGGRRQRATERASRALGATRGAARQPHRGACDKRCGQERRSPGKEASDWPPAPIGGALATPSRQLPRPWIGPCWVAGTGRLVSVFDVEDLNPPARKAALVEQATRTPHAAQRVVASSRPTAKRKFQASSDAFTCQTVVCR
jgi:hypothetical protein